MSDREFVVDHPRLFHMAEAGSHASILENGLLSTSALLDLFEAAGEERHRIESCRRPEMVELHHPEHGTALIRDNKPINEKSLAKCLTDMTMREWYETLNCRVFFRVDEKRLAKLLNARAYRGRNHLILEIDTKKLVERHHEERHHEKITLSTSTPARPSPSVRRHAAAKHSVRSANTRSRNPSWN